MTSLLQQSEAMPEEFGTCPTIGFEMPSWCYGHRYYSLSTGRWLPSVVGFGVAEARIS